MTDVLTASRSLSTSSFEDFYRTNRPALASTLAKSLGDHDLGFEAADEAMSRAFQSWAEISTYSNPQGWVFRTGRNWAISVLRRRTNGRSKTQMVQPSLVEFDRWPETDVGRAIARLTRDHRTVVWLRFYADWSIDQIAVELGIPSGTVKSRISRALVVLASDASMSADDVIGQEV